MKVKKLIAVVLVLMLTSALLYGCSGIQIPGGEAVEENTPAGAGTEAEQGPAESTARERTEIDLSFIDTEFSNRDLAGESDGEDISAAITLSDAGIAVEGEGASAEGNILTVTEPGVYRISGTLSDGMIVVDAAKTAKVQLVLGGVSVHNGSGPALYVKQADKVFLTLAEGSESCFSDGETYTADGLDNSDAAVFSKEDLTVNGTGALNVTGNYRHGVVSKDDLVITGGHISVSAVSTGLCGKDSLRVANCALFVEAGTAALRADNDEDEKKGYIYISSGMLSLEAGTDGVNAVSAVLIADGDIRLNAGDDGIHTNGTLGISGGTLTVTQSYEGIEGAAVCISGGTVNIKASDDGINAAGGTGESDALGWGKDSFMDMGGDYEIVISGGYILIDAGGDGVDSNGDVTVSGGVLLISGPETNANSAIDAGERGGAFMLGGIVAAAGSSGMAEGFSDDSSQGSILYDFGAEQSSRVTLMDAEGNLLVSFAPKKRFSSIILSAPGMAQGGVYTLLAGGEAMAADENGFASSGALEGATETATVTLDTVAYSNGGSGGGHGFGGGAWERPEWASGTDAQRPDRPQLDMRERASGTDAKKPGEPFMQGPPGA